MTEKVPDWQTMWGAKVKSPVDMPDDVLKDAITFSMTELSACSAENDDKDNAKQNLAIQRIKEHMDEKWSPSWHVICGRNFGSLVTHEAKRFVYFYVEDKAVMIYKAG